jgi:hypothetical protein
MAPPPESAARTRSSGRTTRDKMAVIYADQQTKLDGLARELQDIRTVRGERITANTLIRVALDGLIEHSDRLYGDNEEELHASWLEFLSEQAAVVVADEVEDDEDQVPDDSHS